MWKMLPQAFRSAGILLIFFSVLCGFIYPVFVTGIGQIFFAHRADGSLITVDGHAVGSKLIGQPFRAPGYFWPRPSATTPFPYNAESSGASNLGPSNPLLREHIEKRIARLMRWNPSSSERIPIDLVTSSASGLDPDISPAAALYQVARIAEVRHLPKQLLVALVRRHIQGRAWGLWGAPRVNVLMLNVALKRILKHRAP
ncbi:MAG: potassium-transporting ATPase subunit KdpC [Gammaproteobacteria bacterium]